MSKVTAWTDNWDSANPETIHTLRYVLVKRQYSVKSGSTETVQSLFEIDVRTATMLEMSRFFKQIAKYCGSREYLQNVKNSYQDGTQFQADTSNHEAMFIKWFTVQVQGQPFRISHDCAFDTILVGKKFTSGSTLWITKINRGRRRFRTCKHAYAKNKRDAYKIMSNLVKTK